MLDPLGLIAFPRSLTLMFLKINGLYNWFPFDPWHDQKSNGKSGFNCSDEILIENWAKSPY